MQEVGTTKGAAAAAAAAAAPARISNYYLSQNIHTYSTVAVQTPCHCLQQAQ
jgi:cobalamin biosynthesis protein CbiD